MERRRRPMGPVPLILAAIVLALAAGLALRRSELCPACKGFTIAHTPETRAGIRDPSEVWPCRRCDGAGSVSPLNAWFRKGGRD